MLKTYANRVERLNETVENLEVECHQLRTRLTRVENEKDQLEKQLVLERGCGERLECDLDHSQSQLSRLFSDKVHTCCIIFAFLDLIIAGSVNSRKT